jgi:mRNA interferase MazF
MRPIHIARLDKARPVLILTRELVRPHLSTVTVAPITTTIRGLSTEVPVDTANGLAGPSVVSCDNITTIPTKTLEAQIGVLLDHQEPTLSNAIRAAFDLDCLHDSDRLIAFDSDGVLYLVSFWCELPGVGLAFDYRAGVVDQLETFETG